MELNKEIEMTPENFKTWLQGYYELSWPPHNSTQYDERQLKIKLKLDSSELDALNFCYFLNGYYELSSDTLSKWDMTVKDHLKLVFNKITPDRKSVDIPKSQTPSILDWDWMRQDKQKQDGWKVPYNPLDGAVC
jgi:hypothetical protein